MDLVIEAPWRGNSGGRNAQTLAVRTYRVRCGANRNVVGTTLAVCHDLLTCLASAGLWCRQPRRTLRPGRLSMLFVLRGQLPLVQFCQNQATRQAFFVFSFFSCPIKTPSHFHHPQER
jgi:hypothetical protein